MHDAIDLFNTSARTNRLRKAFWPSLATVLFVPSIAFSQPVLLEVPAESAVEERAAREYWSPDRQKEAVPMPLPSTQQEPEAEEDATRESVLPEDASPGFAPGSPPAIDLRGDLEPSNEVTPRGPAFELQASPPFSPPSNPTDFINYAPFQRYTWFGGYRSYPISTIGKLFFTQGGQDFVCSASVINRNVIATAGHCIHDGSGSPQGWSTNVLFCPSYNRNTGIDPAVGCWRTSVLVTSRQWFDNGAFDRDYACAVTRPAGTIVPNNLGNVTGWLGRAWNFSSRQATYAWGYPAATPFPGTDIITSTSTEWYEVNMTAGDGQVSKYIGSDQTGGSSGGPWWLNMAHSNNIVEYADSDGSSITDPAQTECCPWINGVNSHKRCNQGGCPAGSIFTQEMGSPQFRNTAADNNESEDVFGVCFDNGGT